MADLAKVLRDAATKAVDALGTVPKTVTYHAVTVGVYNVLNDAPSITSTVLTLKGVVYKSKVENSDKKQFELIQTKVLIAGQAFGTVQPKEDDFMIIDGVKYEILSIMPAPQDAAFVFVVRAV